MTTSSSASDRIEQVDPDVTRPLRQELLMQHRNLDDLARSDGLYPLAGYFVARTPDGHVVGTASTGSAPMSSATIPSV